MSVSEVGSRPSSATVPDSLRGAIQLNQAIVYYQSAALESSTQATYAAGVKQFRLFSAMYQLAANGEFPHISEFILIYFCVHCAAALHLSHTTIKVYLAAIRNYCIIHGIPHPFDSGGEILRLQLVLRGIKKRQCSVSRPRLPITSGILRKLVVLLQEGVFDPYMDALMMAALAIGWFGCLRCGELTSRCTVFDAASDLCVHDAQLFYDTQLKCNGVCVRIKSSKTDPFRKGHVLKLYETGQLLCPYRPTSYFLAIRQQQHPLPSDPLFATIHGPLSRHMFIKMLRALLLKAGINPSLYSGHSLRKGLATSMSAAQLPDHVIKLAGRWSSDAYQLYIHTPKSVIALAQRQVADPSLNLA